MKSLVLAVIYISEEDLKEVHTFAWKFKKDRPAEWWIKHLSRLVTTTMINKQLGKEYMLYWLDRDNLDPTPSSALKLEPVLIFGGATGEDRVDMFRKQFYAAVSQRIAALRGGLDVV